MQLCISQKGYNSNIIIKIHEWNHNDSRLLLLINKREYNQVLTSNPPLAGWSATHALQSLLGMGNKPLSPWSLGQESPHLRFSLMGMKKASCSMSLAILRLWDLEFGAWRVELLTSLSKAKRKAYIERGEGDRIIHKIHGIGLIIRKLPWEVENYFPSMEIWSPTELTQARISSWIG